MSFLWNTKNTDRNGVNEQKKYGTQKERDNFRKGQLVLVSNTPFFRTTPYFTNPSLFIKKSLNLPFWENFKNSNLPSGYNYDTTMQNIRDIGAMLPRILNDHRILQSDSMRAFWRINCEPEFSIPEMGFAQKNKEL